MVEGCLSCEVVAEKAPTPGGWIFVGDHWTVSHAVSPAQLAGFLIVQPKRHVEHVAELTRDEAAELGPLLAETCRAIGEVLRPAKTYVCSFGEAVKHVHFSVIPRAPDMPDSGLTVLDQMFRDGRWGCADADAARVAAQVRGVFRRP